MYVYKINTFGTMYNVHNVIRSQLFVIVDYIVTYVQYILTVVCPKIVTIRGNIIIYKEQQFIFMNIGHEIGNLNIKALLVRGQVWQN